MPKKLKNIFSVNNYNTADYNLHIRQEKFKNVFFTIIESLIKTIVFTKKFIPRNKICPKIYFLGHKLLFY